MRPPTPPTIHRDDVTEREVCQGDLAFTRRRLGAAAGCRGIGCSLYTVPAGARQMPFHVHADEEEIFYVLSGGGISVTGKSACAVGADDTIVARTGTDGGEPHTLIAGEEGMEVLAFGTGSDTNLTWLPRPKVMWAGPRWLPADGPHPFAAEADAGPLETPEAGERTSNVVHLDDCRVVSRGGAEGHRMARAAGARRSGLNHVRVVAGEKGAPMHCHSMEEELFVVLDGHGTLRLGEEEHELGVGSVVARPPATRVAHQIRAGAAGITYLAYGTSLPGDTVLYPDLRKVLLRGVGVTLDLPADQVDPGR